MSTHKHIDIICVTASVFALLITVLFMNGKMFGISAVENENTSTDMFTQNDLTADWNTDSAAQIILSDGGSTVSGNGAYIYDGDIYIAYSGKYIISGELSNGNIIVNANENDKIWIMLNGISVHCEDDAALRIEQAGKVFLTLADGSQNTLSSGAQYSEDIVSSGVDGTVYSRDDLTVNGSGTLNVTAEYRHGIVCNDDLIITGGCISVNAVQDGFHANDSIRIKDADISISAGDDGITASNDDETAYLYIESGKINISSCYEGLEAVDITVAGGTINISPTDDGINANGSGENSVIRITGGDITVINGNGRDADGIDSNKDIYISGGKLFISLSDNGSNSAIDYGSEYGGVCEISGGTVTACGSSGMAEGFSSSSSQGFIMYNTKAEAGTELSLENSDGNIILKEEIPCAFSSAVISTPEMAVGEKYIVKVGENEEEITVDNTSENQSMNIGRLVAGIKDDTVQGGRFGGRENIGDLPSDIQGNTDNANDAPPDMQFSQSEQGFKGEQGFTPPDQPDSAASDDGGFIPEMTDGANNFKNQSDFQERNENFSGRESINEIQESDTSATTNISKENIMLVGISAVVLIIGCVIAFIFKGKN